MMKHNGLLTPLVILTMAALSPVRGSADSATSGVNQPQVTVPEDTFDFGRVPQGSSIAHGFWLKSTGGDTLKISDVKPGCGCTKAPLDKNVLAAGDSTLVNVIFSTGHYSSTVRKSARILSNAAGNVPRLSFSADVQRNMDSIDVYRVKPYLVDLDDNWQELQANGWTTPIALHNVSDRDLTFHVVSKPQDHVRVDFPDGLTVGPNEQETFRVTFQEGVADELFTGSLTLEANDPAHTRVTIPLVKDRRWGPAPLSQR